MPALALRNDDFRPTARRAWLLVGPTGSGKSPLGELIARRGLWSRRCLHFDFGEKLRTAAYADPSPAGLAAEEVEFLRGVLARGALLEDGQFALAERILAAFLCQPGMEDDTVVVLNGLPRHIGQAQAIDRLLAIDEVIELRCSPETVLQRIRRNAGGDRAGRRDDDEPLVRQKVELFSERTSPLVAHYRARGARLCTIDVDAATTAEDVWQQLSAQFSPFA
ncbi:MAG: nucleoside monophosphate kinase [Thermoguttaceae bacterium]|nr:nucleoside monophosphate kinase [Thermoguttaceae bacterium]